MGQKSTRLDFVRAQYGHLDRVFTKAYFLPPIRLKIKKNHINLGYQTVPNILKKTSDLPSERGSSDVTGKGALPWQKGRIRKCFYSSISRRERHGKKKTPSLFRFESHDGKTQ